jgi:hypothetical protein
MPAHLRLPLLFAFHTAWREGDILALDFKGFDGTCFEQQRVKRSKKQVSFFAPCTRAMQAYINQLGRTSGPLFLNASGESWEQKSFQNEFHGFLREHGMYDLQISSITGHKLKEKNQALGSYANRTKLIAQKVIAVQEKTWLADLGADLVSGRAVNQTVNCPLLRSVDNR